MRTRQIFLGLAASTAVQSSQFDISIPLGNVLRSANAMSDAVSENLFSARSPQSSPLKSKRDSSIPIVVTNLCSETIWPAFASQAGTGPGTGGFELAAGATKNLTVGTTWQGRVWGRTNCTFNVDGTGASNLNGNNGAGAACVTGDCNGVLDCVVTGDTPVTLAEFDLAGGVNSAQTYYDISLVDGYNLPMGLTYIPGDDPDLQEIPPNLTNAACIATMGLLLDPTAYGTEGGSTNASYPIPYNQVTTNADLERWCPWNLQKTAPTKPGDGVYPYPDDKIQRPAFDPCYSACAKTNAPSDCCTGSYDDPKKCKPGLYSKSAKAICPDAYSFAYDDTTSTFIIPSGGGWEITFCPVGRSTNILNTFGTQLSALASAGKVDSVILADAKNITLIQSGEATRTKSGASLGALVLVIAFVVLW